MPLTWNLLHRGSCCNLSCASDILSWIFVRSQLRATFKNRRGVAQGFEGHITLPSPILP